MVFLVLDCNKWRVRQVTNHQVIGVTGNSNIQTVPEGSRWVLCDSKESHQRLCILLELWKSTSGFFLVLDAAVGPSVEAIEPSSCLCPHSWEADASLLATTCIKSLILSSSTTKPFWPLQNPSLPTYTNVSFCVCSSAWEWPTKQWVW